MRELTDNDKHRIEQQNPFLHSIYHSAWQRGAEYATIYEREKQQLPAQKDEPDWNKLAALKPPENLGGVYHGCWLEGAAQGYSKCMITIVAEWRRRYYQSEVVKKELEVERTELKSENDRLKEGIDVALVILVKRCTEEEQKLCYEHLDNIRHGNKTKDLSEI